MDLGKEEGWGSVGVRGWGMLVINAIAPCNIVAYSSRSDFDFLEIAGNVQKFIDLHGKSAKNCRKSSYDNWLLSYEYIIM